MVGEVVHLHGFRGGVLLHDVGLHVHHELLASTGMAWRARGGLESGGLGHGRPGTPPPRGGRAAGCCSTTGSGSGSRSVCLGTACCPAPLWRGRAVLLPSLALLLTPPSSASPSFADQFLAIFVCVQFKVVSKFQSVQKVFLSTEFVRFLCCCFPLFFFSFSFSPFFFPLFFLLLVPIEKLSVT